MNDKGNPTTGDKTASFNGTRYILTIKPAIAPEQRQKIENVIEWLGYHVTGGGTCMDMSECDISFYPDVD